MDFLRRHRHVVACALFAVVFSALSVAAYTRKSATWDEPQHLTAGYMALSEGDFRMDPEHPPLARMWAALPLLGMDATPIETPAVDRVPPLTWVQSTEFEFAHRFLFRANDADALLDRARFMNVLLGVLLGILVYRWVLELYSFPAACAALAMVALEPNLLAHSQLVTTDFPVACFLFGALYFLWRTLQRVTPVNLLGFAGFFALAQLSKFSAVLLVPIAVVALTARALEDRPWNTWAGRARRLAVAAGILAGTLAVTWVAVWAAYGFRYLPSATEGWRFDLAAQPGVLESTPKTAAWVEFVDSHRLLPNACSQGFLLSRAKAETRGAYLAGRFSEEGWWTYFPLAFLLKTPVAVIVWTLAGLVLCGIRWRRTLRHEWTLLLPAGLYLGAAISAKLNIGLRHILPLYPLWIVIGAGVAAALWEARRRALRWIVPALLVTQAVELGVAYPSTLAFFNLLAGGPSHGQEWLVDSNFDWGQDLAGLKTWMSANDVEHVNLSYFGTADPAYYGIDCTPLLGAPFFQTAETPRLPGYVVISATNLMGVYLTPEEREFFRPLREREPLARIGYTLFVYRVERPWWPGSGG